LNKAILLLLLLSWAHCPIDGAASTEPDKSQEAKNTNIAASFPDSVLNHFFALLRSGKSGEAQELFLVRNADQRSAVRDYVTGGIEFFAEKNVRTLVVRVFEEGQFSICAIEQTSNDFPEKYELESGCLVDEGGRWRILPHPQDYRAKLNELSQQEIAEFDLLREKFSNFKRNYTENRALKKSGSLE